MPGSRIIKKTQENAVIDSTPSRKRLRSNSDQDSTPVKNRTPTNWTSPRKCQKFNDKENAVIDSTPSRKRLRSNSDQDSTPVKNRTPTKWTSPRKRQKFNDKLLTTTSPKKSPRKRLLNQLSQKLKWDPRDPMQMKAVKEALHVATSLSNIVCREEEQKKVVDFCKACIEEDKSGSLYVCGCPGTGKTMSLGRVNELLVEWSKEVGHQTPVTMSINCPSLTKSSEIFSKILEKIRPTKKMTATCSPLLQLQKLFTQQKQPKCRKMILLIVDEMDYLITKDREVLHDLFMLTTFPFSRCILVGIANAIDLAYRFLPKLQSLNCIPSIVTFHPYSKDQILKIIQQRLRALDYDVFQPAALQFCAAKVAAASGDMRKALSVCWCAVEVLEAELRDGTASEEYDKVSFHHMNVAVSKAFKSAVVDTMQSLPRHQQIILCTVVKLFRQSKKNTTTIGELNKSYIEICKITQVPAVGTLEFTSMCGVLNDQGLIKLGNHKEDRLRRVTLQINSADVMFAFKNMKEARFFQSCLEC